ncbi:phosphohydrolase [Treponema pectinovorum]|uniref:phosphohydrolase n=1 Tax=Treponema pectinovorum TaxID=164 RepID=UPI0011F3FE4B|nr:phosphohydrolase [Treponema pectinovorum]
MINTLSKTQKSFTKINSSDVVLGRRYSAPVFFDDGSNMFLAEGKTVKKYHLDALKRWSIPFLLTYGHVIANEDIAVNDDYIEDLEEVEELEELEEIV